MQMGILLGATNRGGSLLQLRQQQNRLLIVRPAHIVARLEMTTNRRAFRLAKQLATIIQGQLHAAHTRWFAIGHAWNG
ncbi:hypothetical protein BH10CHL1_BH10CHL1_31520 [soil metagenome]